jgi:NTP pyrophosphatase (non-canonical NTP hydrolase)
MNPLNYKQMGTVVNTVGGMTLMENLIDKIIKWHKDRNLIEGSTDKDQVLKLQQELGELSDSVCKKKDMKDDLGDMMVIMLNIMKRNNITMEDCLSVAYNDIKDRKGKMIDGIFVKETDILSKGFNTSEGKE